MHQKPGKPQGPTGRTVAGRGEAASKAVSDEAARARHEQTGCGVGDLLRQALARENMARAWKRVKANKGSAGVDGRTVLSTGEHLKTEWPDADAGAGDLVAGQHQAVVKRARRVHRFDITHKLSGPRTLL